MLDGQCKISGGPIARSGRGKFGRRLFAGVISALLALTLCAAALAEGGTEMCMIRMRDPDTGEDRYIGAEAFPDDYGSDPDFWLYVGSYMRDKAVFFGQVGLTPRDLGSFVIEELGVTVGFCVPELPRAIRDYALEKGFSAVKMYMEKDPSQRYSFMDGGCEKVYFYRNWIWVRSGTYPDMDDPNARYYVGLTDGFVLPASVLNVSEETVLVFGRQSFISCVKTGVPGEPFQIDRERSGMTIYGGDPDFNIRSDESIRYTDRALEMSETEAQWFVDFIRSVLPD